MPSRAQWVKTDETRDFAGLRPIACLRATPYTPVPNRFPPSLRCPVGRDYDPVPGQWYENLEEEETFQVLNVDEDSELIEIQYLDGDVEEIDVETWAEMDLEKRDEPEGWSGSEGEEDDEEEVEEEDDDDDDDDDWDDDDDDDDDDWDEDEERENY